MHFAWVVVRVVRTHRALLPDAMRAILGLEELSRHPAQLAKDNRRRGGERQTLPSSGDR